MDSLDQMAAKYYCAACGRRYARSDLQMVGVGDTEIDLYLRCSQCQFHTVISVSPRRLRSEPFDAMCAEWPSGPPPSSEDSVTMADLVEMRVFLASFHGDVDDLLGLGPKAQ